MRYLVKSRPIDDLKVVVNHIRTRHNAKFVRILYTINSNRALGIVFETKKMIGIDEQVKLELEEIGLKL
jgi:hypothetical protein